MSDAWSHLTIGIRVNESDFFEKGPESDVCPKGHAPPPGPFCSACGNQLVRRATRLVRPAFASYLLAEKEILTSSEVWDMWLEMGRDSGYTGLAVIPVHSVQSGEDSPAGRKTTLAIGYRLLSVHSSLGRDEDVTSKWVNEIDDATGKVLDVAGLLGVGDRPVELFLSTYWSV